VTNDSVVSRSVRQPTRLVTRTKESNMYASQTVLIRLVRRIERNWYDVIPFLLLTGKLGHRSTTP